MRFNRGRDFDNWDKFLVVLLVGVCLLATTQCGNTAHAQTPAWHPAVNEVKYITPAEYGAGVDLGTVRPANAWPAGQENAPWEGWSSAVACSNSYGYPPAGGHNDGLDRSTYWLDDFTGASPPNWTTPFVDPDAPWLSTLTTPSCLTIISGDNLAANGGAPCGDHNYNQHTCADGYGPVKVGQTSLWSDGGPGGTAHGYLLTQEISTGAWTVRQNLGVTQGTASAYNTADGLVWVYADIDPGSGCTLVSIDPATWTETVHAGNVSCGNDAGMAIDPVRDVALIQNYRTNGASNPWYLADLSNPDNDPVVVRNNVFTRIGSEPEITRFDQSLMFVDTLNSFVVWDGGNRLLQLTPSGSTFSDWTTLDWTETVITLTGDTLPSSLPHNGSTQWYGKMRYLEGPNLIVLAVSDGGYYLIKPAADVGGGDTQAPTVPTGLAAAATGETSIDLSWNASTDDTAVTGYKLFRDTVEIADVATLTYSDTGLTASTSYDYTVLAYDAAGNESAQSASVSETTDSPVGPAIPALGDCADEPGLNGRTDIRFCERFESATWYDDHGYKAGGGLSPNDVDPPTHLDRATLVTAECETGQCLELDTPLLVTRSLSVHWPVNASGAGYEPDELYFRYDMKIGAEWTPEKCSSPGVTVWPPTGKFPGFADVRSSSDPSGQCGNGGAIAGLGTDCWSGRGWFGGCEDVNASYPYDNTCDTGDIVRLGSYLYLPDMTGSNGAPGSWDAYAEDNQLGVDYTDQCRREMVPVSDPNCYCNDPSNMYCGLATTGGSIRTGEWYSIEQRVKMNTPGAADGIVQAWVNGELVYNKDQANFRNVGHDNLHVRTVWLNVFKGGTDGNCEDSHIWLDNLVVAENYIGPRSAAEDTTPPTVPTTVVATATGAATVDVTWTASTDDTAVTGYRIYRDGVAVGTSATTSFTDMGLAPSTAYAYTVAAFDAAGNESAQSSADNATTLADTTAPVITLTGDNPFTITAGLAYTESGATASDDVDGDLSASVAIDASAVNTSVLGSYSVTYNVTDSAGNAATEVTRTVDVVAPSGTGGSQFATGTSLPGKRGLWVSNLYNNFATFQQNDEFSIYGDGGDGTWLGSQAAIDAFRTYVVDAKLTDVYVLTNSHEGVFYRSATIATTPPLAGTFPTRQIRNITDDTITATSSDSFDGWSLTDATFTDGDLTPINSNPDSRALLTVLKTYTGTARVYMTLTTTVPNQQIRLRYFSPTEDVELTLPTVGTYTVAFPARTLSAENLVIRFDPDRTGGNAAVTGVRWWVLEGSQPDEYVPWTIGGADTRWVGTANTATESGALVDFGARTPLGGFDGLAYLLHGAQADGFNVHVAYNTMRWSLEPSWISPETAGNSASQRFLDPEVQAARDFVVQRVQELVDAYPPLSFAAFAGVVCDYCRSGWDTVDAGEITSNRSNMLAVVTGMRAVTDAAGIELRTWSTLTPLFIRQGNDSAIWANAGHVDEVLTNFYGIPGNNGNWALERIAAIHGRYSVDEWVDSQFTDVSDAVLMGDATDRGTPNLDFITAGAWDRWLAWRYVMTPVGNNVDVYQVSTYDVALAQNMHNQFLMPAPTQTMERTWQLDGFDDLAYVRFTGGTTEVTPAIVRNGVEIDSNTLAGMTSYPINRSDVEFASVFEGDFDGTEDKGAPIILRGGGAADDFIRAEFAQSAPDVSCIAQANGGTQVTVTATLPVVDNGDRLGYKCAASTIDLTVIARNYTKGTEDTATAAFVGPFRDQFMLRYGTVDAAFSQNTRSIFEEWGGQGTAVTLEALSADTTPPVITLVGANPQTLEAGGSYVELGATALDDIDGDVTGSIVIDAAAVNMAVPGSYSVTYDVSDAAGNAATQVSRTVDVVDTTAPSVPTGLAGVANSETQINVTWNSSTDAVGVSGYFLYRDGSQVANVVLTSFFDSGLSPGTSYDYTVSAYDAAGNESAQSTIVPVSTDPDLTPPTAPSVAPSVGSITTTSAVMTYAPDCTDALGSVVAYGIYLDSTAPYDLADAVKLGEIPGLSANLTSLTAETDYGAGFSCIDDANNEGDLSPTATFTTTAVADTTAPVITLVGANPQTLEAGGSYVELGATALDDIDGDITGNIVIDATAVNMAAPGGYAVTYNVSDAAGNAATEVSRTIDVVDTTAPSVPTGLSGNGTSTSTIAVSWGAASDLVGVVGYRLRRDGTVVTDQVGLTYVDGGLSEATAYAYTVAAYDAAENESLPSGVVNISTQASQNPEDVIYVRAVAPTQTQKGEITIYRANDVRLVFSVTDGTGQLVDISGFSGRFLMANSTTATPFVDKGASIQTGVFHVDLTTTDTDRTGKDYYEFVITDDVGNVTTFAFGKVKFVDTLR